MLNSKKFVIIMLIIAVVTCLATTVMATTDTPLTIPGLDDTNIEAPDTNEVAGDGANELTNEETNSQVIQPTTNEEGSSYTNNEKLPQTGVTEDITVMFFIVVCAVSAIYAYKKIKDYRA